MKTSDVRNLLVHAIHAHMNVLLVGAPGIGKTELEVSAAQEAKALNYVMHPSIGDPTDAKGMPWIFSANGDGPRAEFVPFGELQQVYDAVAQNLPCALFLDDLGQATAAVQASYMSLMDKLRGQCAIIAATNRRTDRAGVSGLLEPVKSRFATIVQVEANIEDWSSWAIDNNIMPELVAFLNFRPSLLHQFVATQDLVNQPCPRTWTHVNKIASLHLTPTVELAAIDGAVGEGPAAEFIAFLRIARDMPSLEAILFDPEHTAISDKPSVLYAISCGLASKVTVQNFPAIITYAEQLYKKRYGEYAALLIKDCVKRNRNITKTDTFIKRIAASELGKLVRGED